MSDALPIKVLYECFEADYEAGTLTWKERPRSHFTSDHRWRGINTQHAGKTLSGSVNNGYKKAKITYQGETKTYSQHVILWAMKHGRYPHLRMQLDHVNRIRYDNRICNLREVTVSQNQHNTVARKDSESGIKGVSVKTDRDRRKYWRANLHDKGNRREKCFPHTYSGKQLAILYRKHWEQELALEAA